MTGTYRLINDRDYWIVEERGFPIGKSKDKTTARKFLNHLKYGGAFEGKTPDFILRTGAVDLDIIREEQKFCKTRM